MAGDSFPPERFDDYRLIRLLGHGGMGSVYLAHDLVLDRACAIKFISNPRPNPVQRERLLVEARAIARLAHPNVLAIHRVGTCQDRPYLVTEYVRGTSLAELERPQPWRRVVTLGLGLARGVAAAHRLGVLHRDIKPGNVMLDAAGEVKLLDFGVAQLDALDPFDGEREPGVTEDVDLAITESSTREGEEGATVAPDRLRPDHVEGGAMFPTAGDPRIRLTREGAVLGTRRYMAPEVERGEPASRPSDVYSLGVVLFELLAGEIPPHAADAAALVPEMAGRIPDLPSSLTDLVARCLAADPARRPRSGDEVREVLDRLLAAPRVIASPSGNPYRGLAPFDASQRDVFFGRDRESEEIIERLRGQPLVMVAGDSGVGKSSLCLAGVLPRVEEGVLANLGRWSSVRVMPGRRPLASLLESLGPGAAEMVGVDGAPIEDAEGIARALRRRGANTLLVVDQMEELITVADAVEAERFGRVLAGLLDLAGPRFRVLGTVRSDFLTRLAGLPWLGRWITQAVIVLPPIDGAALRDVIVGPARAVGATFESEALVDRLVAAGSGRGGALPLLGFALGELWEARQGEVISEASLAAIGGVEGALGRHADRVLEGMADPERRAARRILLALVGEHGTRESLLHAELAEDATALVAVEALVRGRLVVTRSAEDGLAIELAHDALVEGWRTLRDWIDAASGERPRRRRVEDAARQWSEGGRAADALWSERRLGEAVLSDEGALTPNAQAFLQSSRQAVRRRRVRRWLAAIAIPAVVVVAYGGLRFQAQRDLEQRVARRATGAIASAEPLLALARQRVALSASEATESWDAFDRGERDRGERAWADSLAAGAEARHHLGGAGRILEEAVLLDVRRMDTRALLAETLLQRAILAEREHEPNVLDELLTRLAVHSPELRAGWDAPIAIVVTSSPSGAEVKVAPYEERAGRRVAAAVSERAITPARLLLRPGSWLLTLERTGRQTVLAPITIARVGETGRLPEIELPAAGAVPDGFAYVPAGRFLEGSADELGRKHFFRAAPLHSVETGPFLVARHEVTWAAWIAFLRAIPEGEARRRTPRAGAVGAHGSLHLERRRDGRFALRFGDYPPVLEGEPLRYRHRDRRAVQDWLKMPASGMTCDDAEAFAAWLDATRRLPGARLCSEREWERAARGGDDRRFPPGDRIDVDLDDDNNDRTYGHDALAMGPDEVGAHPASRSPFGVDDLAGNVGEWTSASVPGLRCVARGGAYYFDPALTGRVENRVELEPDLRDPSMGMRICADWTTPFKGGEGQ